MKLFKGSALILAGMLLCSCAAEQKLSKQEVAESISDISSDEEGNVSIVLEDGRVFSLGNLKGEKVKMVKMAKQQFRQLLKMAKMERTEQMAKMVETE